MEAAKAIALALKTEPDSDSDSTAGIVVGVAIAALVVVAGVLLSVFRKKLNLAKCCKKSSKKVVTLSPELDVDVSSKPLKISFDKDTKVLMDEETGKAVKPPMND